MALPAEANGVLRHLHTLFRSALDETRIDVDPKAKVRLAFPERLERDRVLSDSELDAIWQVCGQDGRLYGRIAQLLILTGRRVRDVAELLWSELDLESKVWHLPGTCAKKNHDIALADPALAITGALPRIDMFWCFQAASATRAKAKQPQDHSLFKTRLDQGFTADGTVGAA